MIIIISSGGGSSNSNSSNNISSIRQEFVVNNPRKQQPLTSLARPKHHKLLHNLPHHNTAPLLHSIHSPHLKDISIKPLLHSRIKRGM